MKDYLELLKVVYHDGAETTIAGATKYFGYMRDTIATTPQETLLERASTKAAEYAGAALLKNANSIKLAYTRVTDLSTAIDTVLANGYKTVVLVIDEANLPKFEPIVTDYQMRLPEVTFAKLTVVNNGDGLGGVFGIGEDDKVFFHYNEVSHGKVGVALHINQNTAGYSFTL